MKKDRITPSLVITLIAVIGLVASGSAIGSAGDPGETGEAKTVKKIRIKKISDCEGEDCKEVHEQLARELAGGKAIHVECEGEDCKHHVRVFVKKKGEVTEIHTTGDEMFGDCEGEDCAHTKMIFIGEDGEKHKIHATSGHSMVWTDDDCEGEDCKEERRIIIKGGDGMHSMHGSGDFTWFGEGGDHSVFFGAGKGGFLGIQLTDLSEELRTHFGAPADQGVIVAKVVADSAAQTAGLEVGDIVATVDGEPVGSASELSGIIRGHEGGESVSLGIWRDRQFQTVTAVLGEHETMAPHGMHTMMAFCDEDDEDCEIEIAGVGDGFDCGGAENCEIMVECEDEKCTCTANGEAVDCDELSLPHHKSE